MSVKDTSIEAYKEILGDGTLASTQEIVFNFILNNPNVSDKEIVNGTGLSINCVCGRRNELINEFGLIESNGKKTNEHGRKVYQYRAVPIYKFKKKPNPVLILKCPYCNGKGKISNPQIKLKGFI